MTITKFNPPTLMVNQSFLFLFSTGGFQKQASTITRSKLIRVESRDKSPRICHKEISTAFDEQTYPPAPTFI